MSCAPVLAHEVREPALAVPEQVVALSDAPAVERETVKGQTADGDGHERKLAAQGQDERDLQEVQAERGEQTLGEVQAALRVKRA